MRAFTAIGTVRDGAAYQVEMCEGFRPFRCDVDWAEARRTPIRPLLDRLELTAGKPHWGYQLRFGLLRLDPGDFRLIAEAMGACLPSGLAISRDKATIDVPRRLDGFKSESRPE